MENEMEFNIAALLDGMSNYNITDIVYSIHKKDEYEKRVLKSFNLIAKEGIDREDLKINCVQMLGMAHNPTNPLAVNPEIYLTYIEVYVGESNVALIYDTVSYSDINTIVDIVINSITNE